MIEVKGLRSRKKVYNVYNWISKQENEGRIIRRDNGWK